MKLVDSAENSRHRLAFKQALMIEDIKHVIKTIFDRIL